MAGFDSLPPLSGHPQTGHLWAVVAGLVLPGKPEVNGNER